MIIKTCFSGKRKNEKQKCVSPSLTNEDTEKDKFTTLTFKKNKSFKILLLTYV